MLLGCIVALSGIVGAVTLSSSGVKSGDKTTTGWYCDPLMRLIGWCKSSEKLPTDYQ